MKIGFKFQSLGKISHISAADPPVLLGQLQHWVKVCQFGECEIDICYLRIYIFCRFYYWVRRRVNGKYDAVSLGLVLALLVTRCLHKIHQKFCDL